MKDVAGSTARSDLAGGAGWLIFGLAILAESLRMDRFKSMGATLYTMPGFVPGMIGCALMLLGTVLMLRGWRKHHMQAHANADDTESLFNSRMLLTLALTLVYAVALIGRVPFWLGTAAFVATFTWTFAPPDQNRIRRVTSACIAGVLASAIITLVFEHIFLVRLP
jgi:Tripartite tricarboxylate transporter TctB family